MVVGLLLRVIHQNVSRPKGECPMKEGRDFIPYMVPF